MPCASWFLLLLCVIVVAAYDSFHLSEQLHTALASLCPTTVYASFTVCTKGKRRCSPADQTRYSHSKDVYPYPTGLNTSRPLKNAIPRKLYCRAVGGYRHTDVNRSDASAVRAIWYGSKVMRLSGWMETKTTAGERPMRQPEWTGEVKRDSKILQPPLINFFSKISSVNNITNYFLSLFGNHFSLTTEISSYM